MTVINTEATWVDNDVQLAELCQRWQQQAAVAVDTEFERTSTFYPLPALIQIGDGRGCYLIDPLAITDPEPLRQLLVNPHVTKILHACSEDLEVFQCYLGVVPSPLFDTQLAAAFTEIGFSLGYARLVENMLGIELPKSETRSDWLQRPLSQAQCKYAAMDVAYLPVIYGQLVKRLRDTSRLSWLEADCEQMVMDATNPLPVDQYYLKIKNAWRLNRQELSVLQSLCLWRELVARERNVPRNRVIKELPLVELAKRQPRHLPQLYKIEGLTPRMIDADGEALLRVIGDALELDASAYPDIIPAPLTPAVGDLLKQLKHVARDIAEELALSVEILVRKRDLEALVRSGLNGGDFCLPEHLHGWRQAVIGEPLLSLASQWRAI